MINRFFKKKNQIYRHVYIKCQVNIKKNYKKKNTIKRIKKEDAFSLIIHLSILILFIPL